MVPVKGLRTKFTPFIPLPKALSFIFFVAYLEHLKFDRMKKFVLIVFLALAGGWTSLSAKEGMWIPWLLEKLNEQKMQDLGMTITAEDVYSVNQGSLKDAIVHFGGFCTGEVISKQGLVLTNHHCGYGAIQSHTSLENNYLRDGFWAMNHSEELPNDGLYVEFIKRIEDVSKLVLYEVTDDMTEKQRGDKIKENVDALIEKYEAETEFDAEIRSYLCRKSIFRFLNSNL